MIKTLDDALVYLGGKSQTNREDLRQNQVQRRNQVVDIYGMPFHAQGDTETPASFYISVSPDMIYYQRFEFKLTIEPFAMPVAGDGQTGSTGFTSAQIQNTELTQSAVSLANSSASLAINNSNVVSPNPHTHTVNPASHSHSISPNPHNHNSPAHNHTLAGGVTLFTSSVEDLRVKVEGIDITPYLQLQYPGWIDGEGIYPSEDATENYDLVEVGGLVPTWQYGVLMSPGFKKVEVSAKGVFSVTLHLYLKYSNVLR